MHAPHAGPLTCGRASYVRPFAPILAPFSPLHGHASRKRGLQRSRPPAARTRPRCLVRAPCAARPAPASPPPALGRPFAWRGLLGRGPLLGRAPEMAARRPPLMPCYGFCLPGPETSPHTLELQRYSRAANAAARRVRRPPSARAGAPRPEQPTLPLPRPCLAAPRPTRLMPTAAPQEGARLRTTSGRAWACCPARPGVLTSERCCAAAATCILPAWAALAVSPPHAVACRRSPSCRPRRVCVLFAL